MLNVHNFFIVSMLCLISFTNLANAQTYNITNVTWTDLVDIDSDGYTRSRTMNVTISSSVSGTYALEIRAWVNGQPEALYGYVSPFDVSAGTNTYPIDITGEILPHNTYDWRILLRASIGGTILAIRSYGDDSDLNNENFETAAEDAALTFTMDNVSWTDLVDVDSDSYTRSRTINITITASAFTGGLALEIRRWPDGQAEELYCEIITAVVSGTFTYTVPIGIPSSCGGELSHNIYDFRVLLREGSGGTILAQRGPNDDGDLNNENFETAAEDVQQTYNINNVTWTDLIDLDTDTYTRSRGVTISITASATTNCILEIRAWLDGQTEALYCNTQQITVYSGTYDYSFSYIIPDCGGELPHGTYDFRILLRTEVGGTILAQRGPSEDNDLNNEYFETAVEDAIFSVDNVTWRNQIDLDGDGYTRRRIMDVTITASDFSSNFTLEIRAWLNGSSEVLYSNVGIDVANGTYTYSFDIGTGSTIGGELPHGTYDFRVLLRTGVGGTILAQRGPNDDSDLNDENFETAAEDVGTDYTIDNVSWSSQSDLDGDGYTKYRIMNITITASAATSGLTLEIRAWPDGASEALYFNINIDILAGTNTYPYPIGSNYPGGELPHNIYDFRVLLRTGVGGTILAQRGPNDDSDLNNENFESSIEDTIFSITNVTWSSPVDVDGDSYTRSRNMIITITANSTTNGVTLEIWAWPNGTSESLYGYNIINVSAGSNTKQYIIGTGSAIGNELLHNLYDFKVLLRTEVGGTIVAQLGPTDDTDLDNENFETAAEDQPVTTFQLTVSVINGWNMVSIPGLHPVNQNVNSWWPYRDMATNVFKYSGGYQVVTTATPGEGYFMKHIGARTYNTGDEWPVGGIQIVPHNPISANSGWNIFGAYETIVATSGLTTVPSGLISSPIYKYSGGYQVATTLDPGYGYYVKLTSAGQIIIPGAMSKETEPKEYFPDDWGKILLIDATGVNYTLYAIKGEVDLDQYELPPVPPEGMFDIRYSSGRIAEDLKSAIQTIDMSGVTYPLTVRVEGMDIRLMDETGKNVNVNLKSGEDVVISDATIQKLMVSGEMIPAEYALEQNYPNPFNPSTVIEFSLPENVGNVKLSIYNALGEKVAELVNTALTAGKYQYQWNAQNVATGMYIYELRTDKFVSVKKMMLLK